MSSQISQIVDVQISKNTITVQGASFGIPMIVAAFASDKTTTTFTRIRQYASLTDMAADGWLTSDAVYLAAQAIFNQNPTVKYLYVGRRETAGTPDANWAAALDAIIAENAEWYGMYVLPIGSDAASIATEHTQIAVWTQDRTNMKIAVLETHDANVLSSSSTTDIASVLKNGKYYRTALLYRDASKANEHAAAAWLGAMLPYDVGSATWAYKGLVGCTTDALTVAQKNVAHGKNCNTYTMVSGVSITETGIMCGSFNASGTAGEFADVVEGVDWVTTNLQTSIFGVIAATPKIPYDDNGILAVVALVKGVLNQAASNGILQGASIVVTAPKYKDIPLADRNNRNLPNVTFTALLQGAIHTVQIKGTVSV